MQIARTLADSPQPGRRTHSSFESENKLLGLIAGGLIGTMAFAQPLGAEELVLHSKYYSSETYLELMSYVQQLGDEQPGIDSPHESPHNFSPHNFTPIDRETYSALRNFVQQIGAEQSVPVGGNESPHHSAPARDEDYLALRDFVREIGGDEPAPEDSKQLLLAAAEQPKAKAANPAKAKAAKPAKPINPDDATYVGSDVCTGCHAKQSAKFGQTVMGKIFLKNPRNAQEKGGCETCHGPGSAHVAAGGGRGVGGMISFRADDPNHTPEEINAICLSCHEKGRRILWRGSTHETRNLACTNCHTIMTNVTPKFQLAKLTEIDTCFQCHKNKRAEIWRTSHMPVREGKMTCSTCHNPHGTYGEALLNEATVNDNCYKCHAEKRGPFLWEHPPVRENCLNCHDPHGSINDFLLKISRPRLCQQCHANLTGHPGNPRNPTSAYAFNRECQNCHSQHHGSNSPSGSRFHR
jgi:DmsE family decaheme c-type cytochrome